MPKKTGYGTRIAETSGTPKTPSLPAPPSPAGNERHRRRPMGTMPNPKMSGGVRKGYSSNPGPY